MPTRKRTPREREELIERGLVDEAESDRAVHPERKGNQTPKLLSATLECEIPPEPEPFPVIYSRPIVSFTFSALPSWNDLIYEMNFNRFAGAGHIKRLRELAYRSALRLATIHNLETAIYQETPRQTRKQKRLGIEPKPIEVQGLARYILTGRAMLVCYVWREDRRTYDAINVCIKPICDGFTRARLWPDDNSKFLPDLLIRYRGVDAANPRFELLLFERPPDEPELFER